MPPLGQWLTLLGVFDDESGYWMGLPLQVLREALHTEDRIDERDKIEVTVPDASGQLHLNVQVFPIPGHKAPDNAHVFVEG